MTRASLASQINREQAHKSLASVGIQNEVDTAQNPVDRLRAWSGSGSLRAASGKPLGLVCMSPTKSLICARMHSRDNRATG